MIYCLFTPCTFQQHFPSQEIMANRIQISQFGLQFVQQLPQDLQALEQTNQQSRQDIPLLHYPPPRKGNALDFHKYANQTQQMLFRETSSLLKKRQIQTVSNQSRRKLQLHHQHWVSEQKLVSHKLADIHARLQQHKNSQYDWKSVNTSLKKQSQNILDPLRENSNKRNTRNRSKLKILLARKYPNRL